MVKCEAHENCPEPAVAKVNLPGPNGSWVCERGFDEWQKAKQPKEESNAPD